MKKIHIHGAKNSALPILAATILNKNIYFIDNIPLIDDVFIQIEILKQFNVSCNFINKNTLIVNTKNLIIPTSIDYSKNTRGTYYFIGSTSPYNINLEYILNIGCKIDTRQIDYHIELLKLLGKNVKNYENKIIITGNCINNNINYYFKKPSVGATINALFMFSKTKSTVILNNYAKDPYVIDVIHFLKKLNINIKWDENKIIINEKYIDSFLQLNENRIIHHKLIYDPIETLTWIIFSSINLKDDSFSRYSIGPIEITNLGNCYNLLKNIGIELIETCIKNYYIVYKNHLKNFTIDTDYFPGIYTDIQPLLCILALHIENPNSIIRENIWNNRFAYINEINKFGFNIQINKNGILINNSFNKIHNIQNIQNIKNIQNTNFECSDLRGGIAIYLLMKKYNITKEPVNKNYISRGYYDYDKNINIILENNFQITKNMNISKLSNINIGKLSKYFYETVSINDIIYIINYCNENNIKYIFIGDGNNIYFSDYYDGMIIKNLYKEIYYDSSTNIFQISSGILLIDFIFYAAKFNFDLSKLAGIPGTIGGAIYGNAGAYGDEIGNFILECDVLINNKIVKINQSNMLFDYRYSYLKKNKNNIIISCKIKINKSTDTKDLILKNIFDIIEIRSNKFPTSNTLGSVFKNPIINNKKIFVWKLIEKLNIQNKIFDNIKIHKDHYNIFINMGNADSNNLNNLIHYITDKIYIENNIKIETEIEFIH